MVETVSIWTKFKSHSRIRFYVVHVTFICINALYAYEYIVVGSRASFLLLWLFSALTTIVHDPIHRPDMFIWKRCARACDVCITHNSIRDDLKNKKKLYIHKNYYLYSCNEMGKYEFQYLCWQFINVKLVAHLPMAHHFYYLYFWIKFFILLYLFNVSIACSMLFRHHFAYARWWKTN